MLLGFGQDAVDNVTKTDLVALWDWVKDGRRKAELTLEHGRFPGQIEAKIWVYDYDLFASQSVTSVAEIDLEKEQKVKEKELLLKLLDRYGKEDLP